MRKSCKHQPPQTVLCGIVSPINDGEITDLTTTPSQKVLEKRQVRAIAFATLLCKGRNDPVCTIFLMIPHQNMREFVFSAHMTEDYIREQESGDCSYNHCAMLRSPWFITNIKSSELPFNLLFKLKTSESSASRTPQRT